MHDRLDHRDLEDNLNKTYHRILACTPEQLVIGFSPIDPLQRPRFISLDHVKKNIRKAAVKQQAVRNRARTEDSDIRIGDEVYRRNFVRTSKLDQHWIGPYKVTAISGKNKNSVEISNGDSTERVNIKNLELAQRTANDASNGPQARWPG